MSRNSPRRRPEAIGRAGKNQPEPAGVSGELFHRAALLTVLGLVQGLASRQGRDPDRRRLLSSARGFAPAVAGEEIRRELPAFGAFRGIPVAWVAARVDALVDAGYLELVPRSEHPAGGVGYRLTRNAVRALTDGSVEPLRDVGPPAEADAEPTASERRIRDRLGALRARLARREGRPAFSVLSNAIVAAIAQRRPQHLGDLAAVPGIGPERLRRYGRSILNAVRAAKRPHRSGIDT